MGLGEKVITRNVVYRGRIINLRVDSVRLPNDRKTIREVVEHKAAVAVIPITQEREILMVRQYRYPVEEELLEIPAGLIENGESPQEAAQRELQEEVGFSAESLVEIGRFYSSPGFSDEVIFLFLANGLTASKLDADDDEFITVGKMPISEVSALVKGGAIRDGKTFGALSWFLINQSGE